MSWGQEADARREALAALDRLLVDGPPCTVDDAIAALRCTVALRDRLTARRAREGAVPGLDQRLVCVNAVLTLIWSGTVPIVGFRRKHLAEARTALAALQEDPQHAA